MGKDCGSVFHLQFLIVAILVSFSGILGGTAMLVMGVQYHHALTNYGFSQGDIGKMMITFADTRSNLRAAIGYQEIGRAHV